MMLDDKDRYAAVLQLIVVTENTTWNRFYNFLVFTSVLIFAWMSIHTQANPPAFAKSIKIALSLLGVVSGLFWAGLGWRGRSLQKHFVDLGMQLENDNPRGDVKQKVDPCSKAGEMRDAMMFRFAGSY